MKRIISRLALAGALALVVCLSGCGGPGTVQAEAIVGTVDDVCGTHDKYVLADPTLTDFERMVLLGNSDILRQTIHEAVYQANGEGP